MRTGGRQTLRRLCALQLDDEKWETYLKYE